MARGKKLPHNATTTFKHKNKQPKQVKSWKAVHRADLIAQMSINTGKQLTKLNKTFV